ncbi:hypothetical protein T07_9853 [Trichinella nelsoni]|uniref:Uncharacterized protein n=1 Tax=Trichinella nelsoni TaxID=6336 RepID=A0A0V0SC71_9BILA|nr:hypothetical protein T07_9853 [Trichinella nelsoni]
MQVNLTEAGKNEEQLRMRNQLAARTSATSYHRPNCVRRRRKIDATLSTGERNKWRGWALKYGSTSARRRGTDRLLITPTRPIFQQTVKQGKDVRKAVDKLAKRLREKPVQGSSIHLDAYIPLLFSPKTLSGEPLRADEHTEDFKRGQHQASTIVRYVDLLGSHYALHLHISMVLNKGCSSLRGDTGAAEVHFDVS